MAGTATGGGRPKFRRWGAKALPRANSPPDSPGIESLTCWGATDAPNDPAKKSHNNRVI